MKSWVTPSTSLKALAELYIIKFSSKVSFYMLLLSILNPLTCSSMKGENVGKFLQIDRSNYKAADLLVPI